MRIGISDCVFVRFGDERFQKIKKCGFSHAHIAMNGELNGKSEQEYIQQALHTKALADAAGVSIEQVHGPWICPPRDRTPEERAIRAEHMRRSLRATAAIGCRNWVIHPVMPFGTSAEPDRDAFRQINFDFFRDLLPLAKELGIVICFENMPFPALSIAPPEETLRFVREMNDEHFQMCLDTGHCLTRGVEPADAVRLCGDAIRTLHIHDNSGFRDEHRFPFFGKANWKAFYRALCDIGFDGVFSLEVKLPSELSLNASELLLSTLPTLIDEIMREA